MWQYRSAHSHIFSTQRRVRLRSLIPFRSFRYTTITTLHSFAPPNPPPNPAKETTLHAKTPPALLRQSSHSFRLRYIPCSLPAALAQLASASPYTSAAGKALRYRYAAFPPPRCSRLLSLRCFPLYLPRTIIPVDKKTTDFFSSSLNLNTDSKCLQLFLFDIK